MTARRCLARMSRRIRGSARAVTPWRSCMITIAPGWSPAATRRTIAARRGAGQVVVAVDAPAHLDHPAARERTAEPREIAPVGRAKQTYAGARGRCDRGPREVDLAVRPRSRHPAQVGMTPGVVADRPDRRLRRGQPGPVADAVADEEEGRRGVKAAQGGEHLCGRRAGAVVERQRDVAHPPGAAEDGHAKPFEACDRALLRHSHRHGRGWDARTRGLRSRQERAAGVRPSRGCRGLRRRRPRRLRRGRAPPSGPRAGGERSAGGAGRQGSGPSGREVPLYGRAATPKPPANTPACTVRVRKAFFGGGVSCPAREYAACVPAEARRPTASRSSMSGRGSSDPGVR